MRAAAQRAVLSKLSSNAPEVVIRRHLGEYLESTQPRRSKTSFRFSEAAVHEVGVPTAERPSRSFDAPIFGSESRQTMVQNSSRPCENARQLKGSVARGERYEIFIVLGAVRRLMPRRGAERAVIGRLRAVSATFRRRPPSSPRRREYSAHGADCRRAPSG